jgi:hypothetical protein
MAKDEMEVQGDTTDEIGRRMAEVIDEQDEQISARVDPHWELFYDDEREDAEKIVHLHGDEKVPAQVIAHSNGESIASCTKCDATLEISRATRVQRDARESAGAATVS